MKKIIFKNNLSSRTDILIAVLLSSVFFLSQSVADDKACANPLIIPLDGSVDMKFCEIPSAKSIVIGNDNGESDERPAKARYFHFQFHMGQFEVTQLQFRTVTGKSPWLGKPFVVEGDNYPAVYIDHIAAEEFLEKMERIDKKAFYRLPSEAEFEYAARGGTDSNYYWGEAMNPDFAYFQGNTERAGQHGQPVDSCPSADRNQKNPGYCANQFGLFHMLGNVWEWTQDEYVPNYIDAPINGHIRQWVNATPKPPRVIRGGGWDSNAQSLRSSNRANIRGGYANVGFRVVRWKLN